MTWLKFMRLQKGISQAELAKMLGISAWFLNRIENSWMAKVPENVEARMRAVFGEGWTFKALMLTVPMPPLPDEARECRP